MKIKVFSIACAGSAIILIVSALLLYTQMRAVQNINLDTLTTSLYAEDSKILTWVLSSIPADRVDTMKIPESWAEIFVVNNSDLVIVSSTNAKNRGTPLHRHPELLDQASQLMQAIRAKTRTTVSTSEYMVVIQPVSADQSIIGLKPKAWEQGLVSQQNSQIAKDSSDIFRTMAIFLGIALIVMLFVSFLVAFVVVNPTRKCLNAFEALSLGELDYEITEAKGNDMKSFAESFLRLKTSLNMALERIGRR